MRCPRIASKLMNIKSYFFSTVRFKNIKIVIFFVKNEIVYHIERWK